MLVGVEAPIIAYSETVIDMVVRGIVAFLLLFLNTCLGEDFLLANGVHSACEAVQISTVCHLL